MLWQVSDFTGYNSKIVAWNRLNGGNEMLILVFKIVIVLLVIALLYLSRLKGQYTVRQSQLIDADINTVFDKVRDFKSWPEWSPWIIHEPEAVLKYSDHFQEEEGYYTWEGQYIGAGQLTHISINPGSSIKQKLEFTKPFKAVCEVGFEFIPHQEQTEVIWFMHGTMPFLLRFMTDKTQKMISKDYSLGLAMLNGVLDKRAKRPVICFRGEVTKEPVLSICQGFSGDVKAMEVAMKKSFPELMAYVCEQQGQPAGNPFAAYHQSNPDTMQFVCDMAVPVNEEIEAGTYQLKSLGKGRYYQVDLKGDYEFLELAWYSAIGHIKMLKLKYDARRPALEVYQNDPEKLENSNDWETSLYVPIK